MNACPVCSSKLNNNIKKIKYPSIGGHGSNSLNFREIVFCNRCKTGIAFPCISDDVIKDYYEKGKYWKQINIGKVSKNAIVPYALARARWVNIESLLSQFKNCKNIAILDIGAGYGFIGMFANESKKIDIKRYTCIEPDLQMWQCINSYWQSRHNGNKMEIKKTLCEVSGKYDVVVLSHVLEHLNDPLSMLQSALSFMKSGSILLLEVPNQDYLFKDYTLPHILFYNQNSLQCLIDKTKLLETVSISGYGKNMTISPLNRNISIRQRAVGKVLGVLHGIFPRKLLAILYSEYFGINRKNSNGTWIRALCRKK